MQLTIQLNDGRQYAFAIAEGQASTDFLATVKYWEVFDRPVLRVHDGKDTWAFSPAAIEKIYFQTSENPDWSPPENILSSKCISLETYQRKSAALDSRKSQSDKPVQEGKCAEAMLKVTLASGAIEYFEFIAMLRKRREQLINLYYLFQKIAYTIPCESGGFVLLNPKHIACIHMHPGLPEDQGAAWLVDEFAGLTSQ